MPPRYFESAADAVVAVKGAKGRAAFAIAQREAKRAAMNSPVALARAALRNLAKEEHHLKGIVSQAEDRLGMLRGKLAAARSQVANMAEMAFHTGDVRADAAKIRAQLVELPAVITRAERELDDARDTLARHRARMIEEGAIAAPETPIEAEAIVEPVATIEAEPVDEPARGRGRPRKAA